MAAFFEHLARFVVRFRVPVVALWAVVMIVAIVTLPGLGSEANSDPSLILVAVVLAIAGGLIAGMFGGWRAARLGPAAALARVE